MEPEADSTKADVTFHAVASTRFGETLVIIGNTPELGSWTFDSGIDLVTRPETYPKWYTSQPIKCTANTTLRYKYAVFTAGEFNRWENNADTRICEINQAQVVINDFVDVVPQDESQEGHVVEQTTEFIEANSKKVEIQISADNQAIVNETETKQQTKSITFDENQSYPERNMDTTDSDHPSRRRDRGMSEDSSHSRMKEVELEKDDGVIVAVYYLPVVMTRVMKEESCPSPTNATPGSPPEKVMKPYWYARWDEDALVSRKTQSAADVMRVLYIGCPKWHTAIAPSEHEMVSHALVRFRCVPIFLSAELHEQHYQRYCQDTLKNIFHNVIDAYGPLPSRWWYRNEQESAWSAYTTVNRYFAEKIVEVYNEGDLIWVHGNELLLLPSFLARRLRSRQAHIGLFIHSPFPSSEIFRSLSVREAILRGMLNADQVGFHLYEYSRHFMVCCKRLLGLNTYSTKTGTMGIEYQGRRVMVTMCHAGIEPEFVLKRLNTEDTLSRARALKKQIGDKLIICGVDSVDRLSGVYLKLMSFELLLKNCPELMGKVCLVQVGIAPKPSATAQALQQLGEEFDRELSEFRECRKKTLDIAKRINDNYAAYNTEHGIEVDESANKLVYFFESDQYDIPDRLALWAVSDILMSTALRDGLNLNSFEFIACKHEVNSKRLLSKEESIPVIILSEFAAASRVLSGSLRVNPWRLDYVSQSMKSAIEMSYEEKKARHESDYRFVSTHVASLWAHRVLTDLKRARHMQGSQKSREQGRKTKLENVPYKELSYSGFGLGLGFRSIGYAQNFHHLKAEELTGPYRLSGCRLIFLDYGGTTVVDDSENDDAKEFLFRVKRPPVHPSQKVMHALRTLTNDPRNYVFIVSGREQCELEEAFAGCENLGLVAEHGFFYSWGQSNQKQLGSLCSQQLESTKSTRAWEMHGDHFDDSWKEIVVNIMNVYAQRTNGTYIDRKGSTILWQYRDADPEFGQLQAKELQDHLEGVLRGFPIEVASGKEYLEVRPEGCDKGTACEYVLDKMCAAGLYPEFMMTIGDDVADEEMFQFFLEDIESRENEQQPAPSTLPRSQRQSFSCVVGKKPSKAQYFVNDVDEVIELLQVLAKVSTKDSYSRSLHDMRCLLDLYSEVDSDSIRSFADDEMSSAHNTPLNSPRHPKLPYLPSTKSNVSKGLTHSVSVPVFNSGAKGELQQRQSVINHVNANTTVNTAKSMKEFLDHIAEDENEDGVFF